MFVCACARARARAGVCVCVYVRVRAYLLACVRAGSVSYLCFGQLFSNLLKRLLQECGKAAVDRAHCAPMSGLRGVFPAG